MNLKPKGKWIVGRVVDVKESKGGIALPVSEIKNITVLLLVDRIGPDVKEAKVGDLILYLSMHQVWMRDGTRFGLVYEDEKNIIAEVEDADLARFIISQDGKRIDGQPAALPGAPPRPEASPPQG